MGFGRFASGGCRADGANDGHFVWVVHVAVNALAASSKAGTACAGCDAGGGTEPLGGYSEEGGSGHGVEIAAVKENSAIFERG